MANSALKKILLQTYKDFAQICNNNNIKFYAAYGTAIGAIRNHGLIEWDDDIDVWMLRKDYNKFLKLKDKSKVLGEKYQILSPSDKDYCFSFVKFVNKDTSLWEVRELPYIIGIFIDIFPLDEYDPYSFANKKVLKDFRENAKMLKSSMSFYDIQYFLCLLFRGNIRTLYRRLKYFVITRHDKVEYYRSNMLSCEFELQQYSGDYVLNPNHVYPIEKELFKKHDFDTTVNVKFEDTLMPIPIGSDSILKQLYGDYLTPPPEDKRKSTHGHYYMNLEEKLSIEEVKERINQY